VEVVSLKTENRPQEAVVVMVCDEDASVKSSKIFHFPSSSRGMLLAVPSNISYHTSHDETAACSTLPSNQTTFGSSKTNRPGVVSTGAGSSGAVTRIPRTSGSNDGAMTVSPVFSNEIDTMC
jgi:hypothetical protein